jgi:hypothetical protein
MVALGEAVLVGAMVTPSRLNPYPPLFVDQAEEANLKWQGSVHKAARSTGQTQVKDPELWYEVVTPHLIETADPLITSAYRASPDGTVIGVFRVIVLSPYAVLNETELVELAKITVDDGR